MTSPAFPLDPAALLADSAWLRALARGLVRDSFAADDLAQEAWLVALRKERAGGEVADVERRTWLTGVLRNTAWKQHRAGERRSARERRGARAEALPATAELVARAEMQRALSEAVLKLDEPFRTTILLRYIEDLSSAEIARRQSVPEGTVRWRVQRGLELLRAELEERRGGEWLHSCALVAGLLRLPEAAASATAGAAGAVTSGGSALLSLKSAALAAGLALGGGATAVGSGWIESPWSAAENRMASGVDGPVHASMNASSPVDEALSASQVEVEGDARATRLRTPLAIRSDSPSAAPEDSARSTQGRRDVRVARRLAATHALTTTERGTAVGGEVGQENQVFVVVGQGIDAFGEEALDELGLEQFDGALTEDDRAEMLANVHNALQKRGMRVFAGAAARELRIAPVTDVAEHECSSTPSEEPLAQQGTRIALEPLSKTTGAKVAHFQVAPAQPATPSEQP